MCCGSVWQPVCVCEAVVVCYGSVELLWLLVLSLVVECLVLPSPQGCDSPHSLNCLLHGKNLEIPDCSVCFHFSQP